jgi:hypothetical protein
LTERAFEDMTLVENVDTEGRPITAAARWKSNRCNSLWSPVTGK